jgi:hypothetical protein
MYLGTVPEEFHALYQNQSYSQNLKDKYPYLLIDYATKINRKSGSEGGISRFALSMRHIIA